MNKILTVDEKFEEMWRNTADEENLRDIESYYLDLFNVDMRAAAKQLYVASQDYTSTKFSSYSSLLQTASLFVIDERIYEEFFNAPAHGQEILIKRGHQFVETNILLGFMRILDEIDYPDFDLLDYGFANLDAFVAQLNVGRSDRIDVRLIGSKFIRTTTLYSKKFKATEEWRFISQEVATTFLLLLGVAVGFNLVTNMLDQLQNESTAPTFVQLLSLAKNWEILKEHPLDWAVEIA
jgi:hypothetical protein